MTSRDAHFMSQAVRIARRGLGLAWPNPAVGAVVVAPDGEIVGRGWTAPGGRPHAEAIALERAGQRAEGSTLYVTLEPCNHEGGRGAPCSSVIIAAKVSRVVVGIRDPDPRTAGSGVERLRAAGIEVTEGVEAAQAASVTLGHLMRVTEGRPAVTLKLAVGSDGRIPQGDGEPVWTTGPLARAHGHLLRAMNDAILVGRGTIAADNPSLTCRLPGMSCRSPVRVVMDRWLRTPPTATLFEDVMVPVWLLCAAGEPQPNADLLHDHGAEIVSVPVDDLGMIDPQDALETLAHRGITRVLIEGGPSIAEAFVGADLVDEAVIYQSPNPVGEGGLMPFGGEGLDRLAESGHFTFIATRRFGPDRMTRWRRIRSCSLELSAA
ncbi:bifunctional diaminohydroxyphosphoribosylaminopyrimidine deaminase/5-amino-6-(5-phosphoribosylamino)uracil reductase RibD [Methyloceanibacter caenitepidi]|uniref:Riboflavin biosynthesis protein RibD n=1 Tax=Methyloceanibacter caenitepidi TaxID=1384459 RepID=A0A0A8K3T6_9HYPH|nr:bifunctional diaminohydroxyphosphoribosylaminopyrimidine deaminase/5-amino-6-(5-phosphoribosylamino)uracil reductase RibD [Methyloceanibacter caenitepidi]BAQ17421.1 diaminohydroxyphosphoribosylaminopyrimidine deaminase [Methyloceanibacter caenitepidi]